MLFKRVFAAELSKMAKGFSGKVGFWFSGATPDLY